MLRAIEKRIELLSVKWASPFPGRTSEAKMSGVAIKAAIAVIEHKLPEKRTHFWRLGRLVGASIEKRVFEFKSTEREDEHFEGKVSEAAQEAINGAVLGNTYRAHIQQVVALKPATGEEDEEFTLLALIPPGQLESNTPSSGPSTPASPRTRAQGARRRGDTLPPDVLPRP
jgi:hypothetical protein